MRFTGDELRLQMRGFRRPVEAPRRAIPIYLAGVGPRSVALAGEIADGWISHELTSPAWISQRALPALANGLATAGRSRSYVDVVASACVSVDRDVAVARQRAAGTVAFYATVRTYRDFFAFHGFTAEADAMGAAFRGGTPLADLSTMVPSAMVDALTVCGPPEMVRQHLAAFGQVVDSLKVSPPTHGLTDDEIRAAQMAALDVVAGMDSRAAREVAQ
jgi:alkanesulfonate monooxygenase SsuD/methylene tetrahydromethanopterin reductase-like flavin-dependent oxidoreductase (luciferase family)